MNWIRWILIIVTLLIAAYFTFQINLWAGEFRDLFFYLGDWRSWIAIIAFTFAAGGIIRWILMEEVALTRPRRRRQR